MVSCVLCVLLVWCGEVSVLCVLCCVSGVWVMVCGGGLCMWRFVCVWLVVFGGMWRCVGGWCVGEMIMEWSWEGRCGVWWRAVDPFGDWFMGQTETSFFFSRSNELDTLGPSTFDMQTLKGKRAAVRREQEVGSVVGP